MTDAQVWVAGATLIILILMILAHKAVPNHNAFMGFVMMATAVIFWKMTIYPWWVLLTPYGAVFIWSLVSERSPSI
jgi:hypothetical protein